MAEYYIHNRHSNTPTTTDVPELAAIVVKDGAIQIGDGSTTLAALPKIGTLVRFDYPLTDFATRIQNITPTPEANQYWLPQRMSIHTKGGDTPWSALTNSYTIKTGANINATAAGFVELEATAFIFNYALAEDNVEVLVGSCIAGTDVADFTTHLAKPLGLLLSANGTPTATTKTNGGSGYVANEVITMTSGAVVTVLTVAAGVVATYSVAGTAIALGADTQDSTTGIGTGFTMTIDTVNRYSGGTGSCTVSIWASLETI